MPVHNGAVYLECCLRSIREQTWDDVECVVVDDVSDDRTPDVLAAAAQRDSRLRIVRLKDRAGIVGALNAGLDAARGELVARIDCDDLALVHRLALQVAFLDAHPDVVAVGGGIMFIDEDGDELGSPQSVMGHEAIDAYHLTGRGGALCHGASLLRRGTVIGVGAYRPVFSSAEDLDLFLRLAEVGQLANVPEVIQKVRLHARSHSFGTRAEQRRQSRLAVVDAHRRRGTAFREASLLFPDPSEDTFGTEEFLTRLALHHDKIRTSLKHACRQVVEQPLRIRSWRTVLGVVRAAIARRRAG